MARSMEQSQQQNGETSEIDGYFQTRLWEIEEEVSRSRMQIHALNVAERTYEMERKNHYDASALGLQKLEQRVDDQIEVAELQERTEALQTRLKEVKRENLKLRREVDEKQEQASQAKEAKELMTLKQ